MTTGFGFCANCGTPKNAADQRFCAGCGSDLATAAPSGYPPQPVAPPPPAQWAAPVPPSPAQWVPQPVAPAPAARASATPQLLVVGGLVLAAVVGAYLFMNMNHSSSKSSPQPPAPAAGTISFVPSTFSCSSSASVTSTIRLPSSLKGTDELTVQLDGVTQTTGTVGDIFTQQSDGAWLLTSTNPASSACQAASGDPLSMGAHTLTILDANGKVLVSGSFTLTR